MDKQKFKKKKIIMNPDFYSKNETIQNKTVENKNHNSFMSTIETNQSRTVVASKKVQTTNSTPKILNTPFFKKIHFYESNKNGEGYKYSDYFVCNTSRNISNSNKLLSREFTCPTISTLTTIATSTQPYIRKVSEEKLYQNKQKMKKILNPVTINYKSGKKYLIKNNDTFHNKTIEIQNKILLSKSRNLVNISKSETDGLANFKTNLKSNQLYPSVKQQHSTFDQNANLNNERQITMNKGFRLFSPSKLGVGMLKNTAKLQLEEEPYFYLNKNYGRKEVIYEPAVMTRVFNRNKLKISQRNFNDVK